MHQILGEREKNQEIGIKYHDFGLFLLEGDTGARICFIAHKYMNDAEQISMEVGSCTLLSIDYLLRSV